MVLLGIAHAAMAEHGRLAGMEAGLTAQILRRIRLSATFLALVEQARGLVGEEFGGLEFGP